MVVNSRSIAVEGVGFGSYAIASNGYILQISGDGQTLYIDGQIIAQATVSDLFSRYIGQINSNIAATSLVTNLQIEALRRVYGSVPAASTATSSQIYRLISSQLASENTSATSFELYRILSSGQLTITNESNGVLAPIVRIISSGTLENVLAFANLNPISVVSIGGIRQLLTGASLTNNLPAIKIAAIIAAINGSSTFESDFGNVVLFSPEIINALSNIQTQHIRGIYSSRSDFVSAASLNSINTIYAKGIRGATSGFNISDVNRAIKVINIRSFAFDGVSQLENYANLIANWTASIPGLSQATIRPSAIVTTNTVISAQAVLLDAVNYKIKAVNLDELFSSGFVNSFDFEKIRLFRGLIEGSVELLFIAIQIYKPKVIPVSEPTLDYPIVPSVIAVSEIPPHEHAHRDYVVKLYQFASGNFEKIPAPEPRKAYPSDATIRPTAIVAVIAPLTSQPIVPSTFPQSSDPTKPITVTAQRPTVVSITDGDSDEDQEPVVYPSRRDKPNKGGSGGPSAVPL